MHRVNFDSTPLNGIFDKLAGNAIAVAVQLALNERMKGIVLITKGDLDTQHDEINRICISVRNPDIILFGGNETIAICLSC